MRDGFMRCTWHAAGHEEQIGMFRSVLSAMSAFCPCFSWFRQKVGLYTRCGDDLIFGAKKQQKKNGYIHAFPSGLHQGHVSRPLVPHHRIHRCRVPMVRGEGFDQNRQKGSQKARRETNAGVEGLCHDAPVRDAHVRCDDCGVRMELHGERRPHVHGGCRHVRSCPAASGVRIDGGVGFVRSHRARWLAAERIRHELRLSSRPRQVSGHQAGGRETVFRESPHGRGLFLTRPRLRLSRRLALPRHPQRPVRR